MSRRRRRVAVSKLTLVFVHLIMVSALPDSLAVRGWLNEISNWRMELGYIIGNAMHLDEMMGEIWANSIDDAVQRLLLYGLPELSRIVEGTLVAASCLFSIERIVDPQTKLRMLVSLVPDVR